METIYYNGTILTMEQENDTVEALAVCNGRIAGTGKKEELEREFPNAEKYDLAGKTLMPSFIDAHSHISHVIQMIQKADLSECNSNEDIIHTLKEYMEKINPMEEDIMIGYNYDHNFLPGGKHPTKDVLNQVSDKIPIIINHASLHMCVANDAALRLGGYEDGMENPPGGLIGRREDGKTLNGYLEETGMTGVRTIMAKKTEVNVEESVKLAQELYLKYGVTTVQDGYSSKDTVDFVRELTKNGKIKLDVVSYPGVEGAVDEIFEKYPECVGKYETHFKLGGYKLVLDGSPQGKSAFMTKPYENSGDYRGYPRFSDEQVDAFCKKAVDDNKQILVHCNGDAAGDQFLRGYRKALEESANPEKEKLRPVMIHCQTARNDQLDEMSEMKILPSIFVGHVYYWGDVHVKNFGKERGCRVSPVKNALDRGLVINFHQDTPVTQPKMFHSVWTAVNRMTRGGVIIGPEECVDVYNALKAVTINAAYEYSEEDVKGTLTTGKLADMIIVDRNPMEVPKMELKDIKVLVTMKEGKILYQAEE